MRCTPILLSLLLLSTSAAAQDVAPEIDEDSLFDLAFPHIEQLYLHPEAVDPQDMARAGIQAMEAASARVLVLEGEPGALSVQVDDREATFRYDDLPDLEATHLRLDEVIDFLLRQEAGREEPLEAEDLRIEALRGVLSTIDRHSRLIVGDKLDAFNTRYKGTLVGIGARIGRRAGHLRVIEPFADAPAGRAGLLAMDIISHIDGQSTEAMGVEDAVDRIRGPAGVPVVLTVQRGDEAGPRVFVIARERVLVPSVDSERLPSDIGYLHIDHFSQKTSQEFATHLAAMRADGELRGVVVDLRDNTGGSLKKSARIVNAFVTEGRLVRTEGPNGRPVRRLTSTIKAQANLELWKGPVAVLVNRRTASGSEIVAGGLKFLQRSITIGSQTYGKGTVQKIYGLHKGRRPSSLKMTVARYLLPGDGFINRVGVTPDVETGQLWLDADEVTLPDVFDEPPENIGRGEAHGGIDAGRNPGGGRAPSDEGLNGAPVLRLWYPRVLDGWAPKPTGATPTPQEAAAEDAPGRSKLPGDAGDDLFNDVDLRLAWEILEQAPFDARREELLDLAGPIVQQWQRDETERLERAAAARGLRWATRKTPTWLDRAPVLAKARRAVLAGPPPALSVRLELPELLHAGQDALAVLHVKNTTDRLQPHLRATVEATTDLLDGASFLIGDLDPGQDASWSVPLRPGPGAATRADGWRLYLFGEDGPLGGPVTGTLAVQGEARPILELRVRSEATPQSDGSVEVVAHVTVRDAGPGESGEIQVKFGDGGDAIERAERFRTVGPLKSGEAEEAVLRLRVRDPAAHRTIELPLRARDSRSGSSTTAALTLPTDRPSSSDGWLVPPRVAMVAPRAGRPSRGTADYRVVGEVRAGAGLDSVRVTVGRDEVFSFSAEGKPEAPSTVPFDAPAGLLRGPNAIVVHAVTRDGVSVGRRSWVLGEGP